MTDQVPTPLIEATQGVLFRMFNEGAPTSVIAESTIKCIIGRLRSNPESREWLLEQIGMEHIDGASWSFKENTNE